MKSGERTAYYRPTGSATLRASVHSDETGLPAWPAPDADAEEWRDWLTGAWADRPLAEAVAVASPVLAELIDAVLAGRPADAVQTRRMALALARYWVRMRGRATPFGTFAGVSSARFGPHLSVRWTEDHQIRTQADALWLTHVIARLEASGELRRRLPVVMNDQTVVRGDRLVVTWAPHGSISGSQNEVSVRLIPVVRTVMSLARSPVRCSDLIGKLSTEHPRVPVEALETVVGELIARGVLITSLQAPSTATDPLAHLLDRLREADASDLPETSTLVGELVAIHEQLLEADHAAPWVGGRGRRAITARMRGLSTATNQPVTVDLQLGSDVVLPQTVSDEAAAAAGALIRLSPAPMGNASWREYHGRFLSQYGPGTPVPVDQLIDPIRGLGLPRHFTPEQAGTRQLTPRDEALLALAQQAALDGAHEIVLDDAGIDALSDGKGQRPVSPVALWVDVRAATSAALQDGDFTLAVCGFGRLAGSTGRFLHLLDGPGRQQATELYNELPASVDGAIAAQLSFPPLQVQQQNVQRVPPVLTDVITLAEYGEPTAHRIPVRDLAVAADRTQLYVVSLARRRVVEPMLLHSGARHTMPPLARLLFEIPRSGHPQVTGFDWGAAARLPFLPRVRYGRSILAPAQWRLAPADLPGREAPCRDWRAALESVRARCRLPAGIAVGSGDRKLRLNLNEPMDLALLRAHLDVAPAPITMAEAPTAADHGWFDGRAHEVVVSLAAIAPPTKPPAFLRGPAPLPLPVTEPRKGAVYAKLYGHPELFDSLLTEQVPLLLAHWDQPPQWWFVRYRRPAPHLRLRVRDADSALAAGRVAAWAEDLREHGLLGEVSFDTYRPETGRYGSGPAMDAAEALFAADSAAALAQLTALTATGGLHPQALTAASLVNLADAMTGSRTAGMRWLIDHPDLATHAPMSDREVRRQTLQIAEGQMLHHFPGGEAITAAWEARSRTATRYAASLTSESTRLTPSSVLTAVLHMHHVRALGIDAAVEGMTFKLARSVALAEIARQNAGEGDDK